MVARLDEPPFDQERRKRSPEDRRAAEIQRLIENMQFGTPKIDTPDITHHHDTYREMVNRLLGQST